MLCRVQAYFSYLFFTAQHRKIAEVVDRVNREKLSYLGRRALYDLANLMGENERKRREGILIEAGCALGGSSIVLASAKEKMRPLFVYDVFGLIPPPSDQDGLDVQKRYETIASGKSKGIKGNPYYGYEEDLLEKVKQSFIRFGFPLRENNVSLIKGLFEETLSVDSPVVLAHIDCDWYQSVLTCLERIEPHLVSGGALVIDDYDCWSGCRKAVDEYFQKKDKKRYQFIKKNRLHILKK